MNTNTIILGEIKAVLFDLYGTLIDITIDENRMPLWDALSEYLYLKGISKSSDALRMVYFETLDKYKKNHCEGFIIDHVVRDFLNSVKGNSSYGSIKDFAEKFRELSIVKLTTFPYTYPLLKTLKDMKIKLGIISNTEALFTWYDIKYLNLDKYFDEIILSSEEDIKKPDPRIFYTALSRLNLSSDEAIFIGNDYHDDIIGSKNAGIKVIYLTNNTDPSVNISYENSKTVITSEFKFNSIIKCLKMHGLDIEMQNKIAS
jgi:putative hydrolase of the HAD superfamily